MKNEILTLARIALISALTLSMISSVSAKGGCVPNRIRPLARSR